MLKPSQVSDNKTKEHDDLHLWLVDESNVATILSKVMDDTDCHTDAKIENTSIEVPLYSGYNHSYLMGVCDCIIKYTVKQRYDDMMIQESHLIVIEVKPTMNSMGGTIRQIKIYRDCAFKMYHANHIHMVVLTYDNETKYDKMLENEGISIIRILRE